MRTQIPLTIAALVFGAGVTHHPGAVAAIVGPSTIHATASGSSPLASVSALPSKGGASRLTAAACDALEICNGADDDQDGLIDEGLPDIDHSGACDDDPKEVASTLPGWASMRLYELDHTAPGAQSEQDYQVLLEVNTEALICAGKLAPDCSDLRVSLGADCTGVPLPFWVADGTCDTARTQVWIKLSDMPSGAHAVFALHYGAQAQSASDGEAVFPILFDDFNGEALDTDKWVELGDGDLTQAGGILTGQYTKAIQSTQPVMVEGETVFGIRTNAQAVGGDDIELGVADLSASIESTSLHHPSRSGQWATWLSYNYSVPLIGNGTGDCEQGPESEKWTNDPGDDTWFLTEFFYELLPNGAVHSGIYDKQGRRREATVGGGSCSIDPALPAYYQWDHSAGDGVNAASSLDYAFVRNFTPVDPILRPYPGDPDADLNSNGVRDGVDACEAIEVCDGRDNDGDEAVDEGDYPDFDHDEICDRMDPDDDDDGIPDDVEIAVGTNPTGFDDFDGDGVGDYEDEDDDNDGIPDVIECRSQGLALVNGSFEEPQIQGINNLILTDDQVPGWTTSATDHNIELWASGFQTVPAAVGRQFAELNAYEAASLYQDVPTIPGTQYLYRFYHRGRSGVDTLGFSVGDGEALELLETVATGPTSWSLTVGLYTVPPGQTTTRFIFDAVSSAGGPSYGNFLDGIEFIPVCTVDTDHDGAVDSHDLDSDADGLTDAEESGHDLPAPGGQIAGPFGANGLSDGVETAPDSGQIAYTVRNTSVEGPPDFQNPDRDGDEVPDGDDNCPLDPNPGQADADHDGQGDACDDVFDTPAPTPTPEVEPTPTASLPPTEAPTPTASLPPTEATTEAPTDAPTEEPTAMPTEAPTDVTTATPTVEPWLVTGGGCSCDQPAQGRGAPGGAAFALAALTLGLLRRRRSRLGDFVALAAALGLFAPSAFAQSNDQGLSIQRFTPEPGAALNYDHVEGAATVQPLRPTFGLWVNDAFNPLTLTRGDDRLTYVTNDLAIDLVAGLGVTQRFQIGLALPMTLRQAIDEPDEGPAVPAVRAPALGDLRIVPKVTLVSSETFALALSVPVSLPTGSAADLHGDASLTLTPRIIAEVMPNERLRAALNLGLLVRPQTQTFLGLTTANELQLGLGASYLAVPDRLALIAEIFGGTTVGAEEGGGSQAQPMEANVAARLFFGPHTVTVGGGPGFTDAYGSPTARLFLGYGFTPGPRGPGDKDKDGLKDDVDQCPDEPEDLDGFQDEDGCPDPDNDGDGIPDTKDKCPDQAEDMDGLGDADGCPEVDFDGDGILDEADKCPSDPETINGVDDDDGCPDKPPKPAPVEEPQAITIDATVYFDFNMYVLSAEGRADLDEVVRVLRAHPEIKKVLIEGHTDDVGTSDYNVQLGQARADTVKRYMVNAGVESARLRTLSYGEERPAASNATDEGRAKNRRALVHPER